MSDSSLPPVGIVREDIWLRQRGKELCRTIERYLDYPHATVKEFDLVHEWIQELSSINSKLTSRWFAEAIDSQADWTARDVSGASDGGGPA